MALGTIIGVNLLAGGSIGGGITSAVRKIASGGKGISGKTKRKIRRAKRKAVRAKRREFRRGEIGSQQKRKDIRALRKQKRKDIRRGEEYYQKRIEKEAIAERGGQYLEQYGTDPMSRQSQQMYGTRTNINRQDYPTRYNQGRYGSEELSSPNGNGVYYSSATNSTLNIDPYSQQLLQL
jgi:hypothetical protein